MLCMAASHNALVHCKTVLPHCLEMLFVAPLLIFMRRISHFLHICEFILCSSLKIHTQPENNAADIQIWGWYNNGYFLILHYVLYKWKKSFP